MHLPQNAAVSLVAEEARVVGRDTPPAAGENGFQSVFSARGAADDTCAKEPCAAPVPTEATSSVPARGNTSFAPEVWSGDTQMAHPPGADAGPPLPDAGLGETPPDASDAETRPDVQPDDALPDVGGDEMLPEHAGADTEPNVQMAELVPGASPGGVVFGVALSPVGDADGPQAKDAMTPIPGLDRSEAGSVGDGATGRVPSGSLQAQETGAVPRAGDMTIPDSPGPRDGATGLRREGVPIAQAVGGPASLELVSSDAGVATKVVDQGGVPAKPAEATPEVETSRPHQAPQSFAEEGDATGDRMDAAKHVQRGDRDRPDRGMPMPEAMRSASSRSSAKAPDAPTSGLSPQDSQITPPAKQTSAAAAPPVSPMPADPVLVSHDTRRDSPVVGRPDVPVDAGVGDEKQSAATGWSQAANGPRATEAGADPAGGASTRTSGLLGGSESVFVTEPPFVETAPGEARGVARETATNSAPVFQAADTPHRAALQIAEIVRASGERRVELRLQPDELGRVQLTMSQDATGALSVALTVERAETLDLLRRNIDLLGAQLRDLGYHSVDFSFQGDGAGGQGARPDHRDGVARSVAADGPAPVRAAAKETGAGITGSARDGIDLRL